MKTILAAALLLCLLAPPPASAQTVATLGEKSIGTACNNGADAVNFDTIAQCSATSGSGTFQKAPLFIGQVTSPPYATTACDAAKAGMLQYTGGVVQYCNGSAWSAVGSGGMPGYEIIQKNCGLVSSCQATCSAGKAVLGGGCSLPQHWAQSYGFPNGTSSYFCSTSDSTAGLVATAACAYASTATGGVIFLGSTATATSPSRADDQTTGLFSDTASTVAIATGRVERLRVTATGSVGIGTTTPTTALQVNGTITAGAISTSSFLAPTVQKFTSGSGTYTTPTSPRGPLYLRVRMVGGGGGGSGSGSTSGTGAGNGGTTTFGTSLLSAGGGGGGIVNNISGGSGGTSSLGTGPTGLALTGGMGGAAAETTPGIFAGGGMGGSSAFGGAGSNGGSTNGFSAAAAGIANTGGGGGGAASLTSGVFAGSGGGAGGFVDAIISSPVASYAYSVGAGGTAGGAGASGYAGGAGGSGIIIVEEYYQ